MLIYSEFTEEYFIPHFSVPEKFGPTQNFHVEAVVTKPSEPAKSIWHGSKVLLELKPLSYFWRQIANYVTVKWRRAVDDDIAASGCLELTFSDLIDISDDLLNRIFLR